VTALVKDPPGVTTFGVRVDILGDRPRIIAAKFFLTRFPDIGFGDHAVKLAFPPMHLGNGFRVS
jgi:hypothetical protein